MPTYPYGSALQLSRWLEPSNHLSLFARIGPKAELANLTVDHENPKYAQKWEKLPPIDMTGFAAVPRERKAGVIAVAVRTKGGSPAVLHQNSWNWGQWIDLGGGITDWPAIVSTNYGDSIFVRGTSGRPFYKDRPTNGVWNRRASGWKLMGGSISGNLNAVSDGQYTAVSALSDKGFPIIKWRDNGVWKPGPRRWVTISKTPCLYPPVITIYRGKAPWSDSLHLMCTPQKDHRIHYQSFDMRTGNTTTLFHDDDRHYCNVWDNNFDTAGHPSWDVDIEPLQTSPKIRMVTRKQDKSLHFGWMSFQGGSSATVALKPLGGLGLDSPVIIRMNGKHSNTRAFVTGVSGRVFTQAIPNKPWNPPGLSKKWQLLSEEQIMWRP